MQPDSSHETKTLQLEPDPNISSDPYESSLEQIQDQDDEDEDDDEEEDDDQDEDEDEDGKEKEEEEEEEEERKKRVFGILDPSEWLGMAHCWLPWLSTLDSRLASRCLPSAGSESAGPRGKGTKKP